MKLKQWLLLIIIWQIIAVAVILIVNLPNKTFHNLVHDLITILSSINSIAILGSLVYILYKKGLKDIIHSSIVKCLLIVFIVFMVTLVSYEFSLYIGRTFCGLDSYQVAAWHMFIIAINLILTTIISVSYVLFFLYHKLSRNFEKKTKEIEELKRLHVESKLTVLQSKVNPHFLFNTLDTIIDIVYQDPKKVEKIILNLSDIYRRVLTLPDNELVNIEEELTLVKDYLEIEKTRMGSRFDFGISIDDKLKSLKIPPLIIEILVENAVQHGIAPKKDGGEVFIDISRTNGRAVIKVTDNGVGMKQGYNDTGFGIYSVQQRLNLVYSGRAKLTITELEEGGTQAVMDLPYDY